MATITAAAGGGNWTAGATWVGGVVPTSADDVLLTATSGNVTIDAGAVCRSLDCLGYTGTLTHSSNVTLTVGDGTAGLGNRALRFVSGMTYSRGSTTTSVISFVSTSATQQTITWGGRNAGSVTFDGAGGSWQIADNWNAAGTNVTLTRGSLDLNGKTCTWGSFSSANSNTRSLTLGAASISVSGTLTSWDLTTTTGLTFSGASSTITSSASLATFGGGGLTYGTVILTGSGIKTVSGANTFAALTRTGTAAKTDGLAFDSNQIVTGTLTLTGNSATNRLLIQSSVTGVQRTITAATVTASNVDLSDISGAGAASWNLAAISGGAGNALGNAGITFTTPVTRYGVVAGNWSATTTWSATSGGAGGASVPLCHDAVILDGSSAAGTYTADMPRLCADLTCFGFTRTLAFSSTATTIYGSVTLGSGMTLSGTQGTTFAGRSSLTITSATITWTQPLTISAPGGIYTLQDAFTCTTSITLTAGTLDTNSVAVTISAFSSPGSTALTCALILGTSTVSLTSTSGIPWNPPQSAFTLSAASATIILSTASASSRTFRGRGGTYGTLTYTVAGSTGGLTITGANTFDTINFSDASNARTLTLPAGATTTILTAFNVNGTAGKLMSVVSSTSGTTATLSKASGTVSCDYLSLKDSAATGGASFYAGANSTDVSGNTGWNFYPPPLATGSLDISGTTVASTTATGSLDLSGAATAASGGMPATGSGTLDLTGTVAAQAASAASGSLDLTAVATAQGTATASGGLSLTGNADTVVVGISGALEFSGAGAAGAPVTAGGGLDLAGTVGADGQVTVNGSLDLSGVAGWMAVAAGAMDLSGSTDAQAPTPAAGDLTLSGAAEWVVSAVSGTFDLVGTAGAAGAFLASGSFDLSGAAFVGADGGGSGALTLTGAAGASAAVTAAGSVTLVATAAAVAGASAPGSLTLTGSAAAVANISASGAFALTGSATAGAAASAAGALVLSGASTGAGVIIVTGAVSLTGAAQAVVSAAALGSLAITGAAAETASTGAGGMLVLVGAGVASPLTVDGVLTLFGAAFAVFSASGSLTLTGSALARAVRHPRHCDLTPASGRTATVATASVRFTEPAPASARGDAVTPASSRAGSTPAAPSVR